MAKIFDSSIFSVEAIAANRGGNTGEVSVSILGNGFEPGASVTLETQGQPNIAGTDSTIPNSSRITTTFDLTGTVSGPRDVVVTLSGGSAARLRNGFTVEEGRSAQVSIEIIGRNRIRAGGPQTYYIVCHNRGNVDAFAIPFTLRGIPLGSTVELGFEVSPPSSEEAETPIDWSQVPVTFDTATDKVLPLLLPFLPAGATISLPVKLTVPTITQFELRALVSQPYLQSSQVSSSAQLAQVFEDRMRQLAAETPALNQDAETCYASIGKHVAITLGLAIPGDHCLKAGAVALANSVLSAIQIARGKWKDTSIVRTTNSIAQFSVNFSMAGLRCMLEDAPVISEIAAAARLAINLVEVHQNCSTVFVGVFEKILQVTTVLSLDPNDKFGVAGFGPDRYVATAEPLQYAIYFENKITATAPAQEVIITDPLDTSKLDLSTIRFGLVAFADKQFTPLPGGNDFTGSVDLRPGMNLVVKVQGQLDIETGVLTWRFSSIDPDTGAPPEDPLAGFLPPGAEGNVVFIVSPRSNLPTGTVINNAASIVFDTNAPLATGVWSNTLDNSSPVSHVHPMPATSCSANAEVHWSGVDFGSNIRDYTIHVSDNGGPFNVWQSNTTATSGRYPGEFGHTYAFYSVARDQTGNIEEVTDVPATQTITIVDDTPPTVDVPALVTVSAGPSCQAVIPDVVATSTATDNCSGPVVLSQNPRAGTIVGVGSHVITITVIDAAGNKKTATTTFTVSSAPAFLITINPTTVKRGNKVILNAAFSNCANKRQAVTLKLSLTTPGSNTLMLALPVTLQAGQNGSFNVPLTIPKLTPAGVYSITLEVYVEGVRTSTSSAQLTVIP